MGVLKVAAGGELGAKCQTNFYFIFYLLNKVHIFCNLFNWRFKPTLFCVLYFNMKKSACVLCQVCQTKESKITFDEKYMSVGQFSNICCAN